VSIDFHPLMEPINNNRLIFIDYFDYIDCFPMIDFRRLARPGFINFFVSSFIVYSLYIISSSFSLFIIISFYKTSIDGSILHRKTLKESPYRKKGFSPNQMGLYLKCRYIVALCLKQFSPNFHVPYSSL